MILQTIVPYIIVIGIIGYIGYSIYEKYKGVVNKMFKKKPEEKVVRDSKEIEKETNGTEKKVETKIVTEFEVINLKLDYLLESVSKISTMIEEEIKG